MLAIGHAERSRLQTFDSVPPRARNLRNEQYNTARVAARCRVEAGDRLCVTAMLLLL